MDSRVVLVTGSSAGIGKATALLFAKNGYKVVVHGSRSQEKVDKVVDECNKLSPNNNKALGLVADFSDPENSDIVVTKTIQHFGGLDVLVSNAGTFFEPESQDADHLYSIYKKTKAVNNDSLIKVTYKAIEHLRKSTKNPCIVIVSSVDSINPAINATAYCLTKATLSMLAKCLAIELAPQIRCNAVIPGPADTGIYNSEPGSLYHESSKTFLAKRTPMKRIGTPEDIANAILYLCDDKASWMTGTNLVIDGGYSIFDVSSFNI